MLLDHPSDGLTAIRTHIGAIFVSLELSRSNWLITSLSPGKGEKMSKHSVTAGDVAGLMKLFAELRRKAEVRTGQGYPIIVIQEAGLDGFWIHRVLQQEGIEGHVVDPASIATSRRRIKTYAFEPRATANRLPRPVDSGQLNREHPFLFAQLQSSNDGTILIGSGGR